MITGVLILIIIIQTEKARDITSRRIKYQSILISKAMYSGIENEI
jgi:hypothetical protein